MGVSSVLWGGIFGWPLCSADVAGLWATPFGKPGWWGAQIQTLAGGLVGDTCSGEGAGA